MQRLTSRLYGSATKQAVTSQLARCLAIIFRRNSALDKDTLNISASLQICSIVPSASIKDDCVGQSPAHCQLAVLCHMYVRLCNVVICYQVWTLELVKFMHANP